MPVSFIEQVGRTTTNIMAAFGDLWIFVGRTFRSIAPTFRRWKNLKQVLPQMYDIGTKSVPVVSITGAFIGMVLAVESYTQFKAIGQETRLGTVINLSVVKQIGPVLAAVMLAGGGGGGLNAGFGILKGNQRLVAPRVLWSGPIRVLVGPAFFVCITVLP